MRMSWPFVAYSWATTSASWATTSAAFGDAGEPAFINRVAQRSGAGAPFDLGKGDQAGPFGDQINLTGLGLDPLGDDPPALLGEPHRGLSLGLAAALVVVLPLRGGAFAHHSPLSSSARA